MSHCFQYLFFRFSNCFNAGFELTGPRASFSFCVLFFASFLVSFHVLVSNDKRSALGPAATDSANYSLRTIPVLSASLGRKVVALSFICSRRNSGKTLAARKKKNNYRCNSAISWGQHLRSKLFALCTPIFSFSSPVTARSVFDKFSKNLCRLIIIHLFHLHLHTPFSVYFPVRRGPSSSHM
jgi:hypothetical protein